jgi:hypothetical protein
VTDDAITTDRESAAAAVASPHVPANAQVRASRPVSFRSAPGLGAGLWRTAVLLRDDSA